MDEQIVLIKQLFSRAEELEIPIWLSNGWAIDARLGEITREHGDIDIAYAREKEDAYKDLLARMGFANYESVDYGFLVTKGDILLDSEPCDTLDSEYNFKDFPKNSCPWEKEGVIDNFALRCVSWEALYLEFLYYQDEVPKQEWREKDFTSLEIIENQLAYEQKQILANLYLNINDADSIKETNT